MARSKDDIKYGAAQAKLSEDEMLRVAYKAGTHLEAGKIAEPEPVNFSFSAHNISNQKPRDDGTQLRRGSADSGGGNSTSATNN